MLVSTNPITWRPGQNQKANPPQVRGNSPPASLLSSSAPSLLWVPWAASAGNKNCSISSPGHSLPLRCRCGLPSLHNHGSQFPNVNLLLYIHRSYWFCFSGEPWYDTHNRVLFRSKSEICRFDFRSDFWILQIWFPFDRAHKQELNILFIDTYAFFFFFWNGLEKTLESPLDCKEIQPVHPKGDQSWVFIGRTDAEAETPTLWPPDGKNWLIGKDPDTRKDWGQEEKGMTLDEVVGWYHQLYGHELE